MTIWGIADIHASPLDEAGVAEKPMERFGPAWEGHVERIEAAWRSSVQPDDTVIVAGDLDWSLHLEDAIPTLERLRRLPGIKLLVRGNHDYWWSSKATNKVRKVLPPSVHLIHNNVISVDGFAIGGAKGSPVPGGMEWDEQDAKLLNRELERLKLSADARADAAPFVAALHFPPFYPASGPSPYVELLHSVGAVLCVYGHLHGESAHSGPSGTIDGIVYRCVAADYVGFRPVKLVEAGRILEG